MRFKLFFILLLLPFSAIYSDVEGSVLAKMEKRQNSLAIDSNKFLPKQWQSLQKALHKKHNKLRIVSYNMLFSHLDHLQLDKHRWVSRGSRVEEMLLHLKADIIGSQELYRHQLEDVMGFLGNNYAWIGKPFVSKSGKEGEIPAIIYNKSQLKLVIDISDTFYCVDSGETRTISGGLFENLPTGQIFVVINTHFPFKSLKDRQLVLERVLRLANSYQTYPTMITADMNAFPNRPEIEALPFYDGDWMVNRFYNQGFRDARLRALLGHFGPITTYTNDAGAEGRVRPFVGEGEPGVILDYILVNREAKVLSHSIDPGKVNGEYPSDHLPVIADIVL